MDTESPPDVFLFEEFRFDRRGNCLVRRAADGEWQPVSLGTRALAILGVLIEQAGELVSKDEIMRVVWPGTVVEEANLTVQISALRRALDKDRAQGSCIQTIPGRGYRFVAQVARPIEATCSFNTERQNGERDAGAAPDDVAETAPDTVAATRFTSRHPRVLAAILFTGLSLAAALLFFERGPAPGRRNPPPLSLVVLPFDDRGADPVDHSVAGRIAQDLPLYMVGIPSFMVVAGDGAAANTAKPIDIKRLGEEPGVRYALQGSARTVEGMLRVDLELVSTETGAHVWTDRYDVRHGDAGQNADDIAVQIVWALQRAILEIDAARGAREEPDNPGAANLLLQARALLNRPKTPERQTRLLALFGRAAELDPSSGYALAGQAEALLDRNVFLPEDPGKPARLRRAQELITKAEALEPSSIKVIWTRVFLLLNQNRCEELVPAVKRALDENPTSPNFRGSFHYWLGLCLSWSGKAAEAVPMFEQSIRDDPRNAQNYNRAAAMGFALAFLGRYDEAVAWFRQSLTINPDTGVWQRGNMLAAIAGALSLGGHTEGARAEAVETMRLWPTLTARSFSGEYYQVRSPVALAVRFRDALRQAGIRDHADEDADFGLPADNVLHADYEAHTPTSTPGAQTIGTRDLAAMLEQRKPLVIDASNPRESLPGAIGLWGAGIGGSTSDEYQDRLGVAMRQLTGGGSKTPVVALAWNAERYQGRNLALRLVALGYTNVYWYRGGREAWEVAGLPETPLELRDW